MIYIYIPLWHARFCPQKSLSSRIPDFNTHSTVTMASPTRVLVCLGLLSSYAIAATIPNTIEVPLTSNFANTIGERHFMNITIGTPGQVQTMTIDTGSSNAIVLGSNASFCETSVCAGGTLNLSTSSTLETIDPGTLQQAYVDHDYFEGVYFRDRVQMSMCKVLMFACCSTSITLQPKSST